MDASSGWESIEVTKKQWFSSSPSKPVDLIREKAADPRKFRSADGSLSRCSAIHRR
jgi:hypothetical protein